jgi:hypothetical protein
VDILANADRAAFQYAAVLEFEDCCNGKTVSVCEVNVAGVEVGETLSFELNPERGRYDIGSVVSERGSRWISLFSGYYFKSLALMQDHELIDFFSDEGYVVTIRAERVRDAEGYFEYIAHILATLEHAHDGMVVELKF